jgi:hypothetical protein
VNVDDAVETARQAIVGADDARIDGLDALVLVRTAKLAMLDRDQQRLAQIIPADDPRLVSMAARIAAAGYLTAQASDEASRSRVEIPGADPNAWTLNGRVVSSDKTRLRGLAVMLATTSGAVIAGVDRVFVNEGGGFTIKLALPAGGHRQRRTPPANTAQETQSQVIVVLQEAAGPVWRDLQPLTPTADTVAYVEVDLDQAVPMTPEHPTRGATTPTTQPSAPAGTSKPPTEPAPPRVAPKDQSASEEEHEDDEEPAKRPRRRPTRRPRPEDSAG